MSTVQAGAYSEGRDQGLEDAAVMLDIAARRLLSSGKRIPAVDQHTASVLQRSANNIRALKTNSVL